MTKNRMMSLINLFSFIAMLAINALATFNLLGASTKEISDATPTLLMPIGLVFSVVWSLIYLLLIAYTVYQLFNPHGLYVERISVYYLMSNVLNMLWILAYHTKMNLISTIIIVGLLVVLYLINRKLDGTNLLMRISFSMYFAWISVATAVSILSYISGLDPTMFDSLTIRIISSVALVILMIVTLIRSKDITYVLTVSFALTGILLKQINDFNGKYPELIIIPIAALILILFTLIVTNVIDNKSGFPKKIIKRESF